LYLIQFGDRQRAQVGRDVGDGAERCSRPAVTASRQMASGWVMRAWASDLPEKALQSKRVQQLGRDCTFDGPGVTVPPKLVAAQAARLMGRQTRCAATQ
jgi:hypothetical protein